MNTNKSEKEMNEENSSETASEKLSVQSETSQLQKNLQAAYATRLTLRREQLAKSLKQSHLLRKNRREIARLKTILHAKASKE